MRKVASPIMFSNVTFENRIEYATLLKETSTDRVFIAVDRKFLFETDRVAMLTHLENHIQFFESQGIEVGVWLQSFGFGNPLGTKERIRTEGMTKIKSIVGREGGDAFCPEDSAYMEMYCQFTKELATTKPALIMLDDDLCLSVRPGIGCFCDHHMKKLEAAVGRKLDLEMIQQEMFIGGKNALRDAYLQVMGDSLRKFCKKIRAAVNEVDDTIRVGFCAGYTSWDLEGANPIELSYILAGKQKPFLRFTSAPYWVSKAVDRMKGMRLHGVIEFARAQEAWCRDTGIEVFTEADSYPRARYQIPAKLIECFDVANLAAADMDSLKYSFDYFSSPNYELGYIRAHQKNQGLREFIEKHFNDKKAIGVRVFEKMRHIEKDILPEIFDQHKVMRRSLPVAAPFLAYNTVPVQYEETSECGIAFGGNVTEITAMPKRLILDLPAALLLQEQGIDVGLLDATRMKDYSCPSLEVSKEEQILLSGATGTYYGCKLKQGAVVESSFDFGEGMVVPAAFTYENGEMKFLVYTFDAYTINQSSSVICSYLRQEQLLKFYDAFPVIRKSPYVYEICKRSEDGQKTVLFVANLFEDELWDFDIKLDKEYRTVECYGVEAELWGTTLHISGEVGAYGMFAVCLTE